MLNARTIRRILWATAALAAGGAVAVLALAPRIPYARPDLAQVATLRELAASPSPGTRGTSTSGVPTLAMLEPVMSLDLRRAIVEGTITDVKPPPPLTTKLAGTIVEPGRAVALLQFADGHMELKGPGEKAGDLEVVEVTATNATVMYLGRRVTLSLENAP